MRPDVGGPDPAAMHRRPRSGAARSDWPASVRRWVGWGVLTVLTVGVGTLLEVDGGFLPEAQANPATKVAVATPTVAQLLADADRARGGDSGVTLHWKSSVTNRERGKETQRMYEVWVLEKAARLECTAPEKNAGEVLLVKQGSLYFWRPGLRKPVNGSIRQKLSGQASNGDVAMVQFGRDYDGQVSGEEKLESGMTWRLDLKARSKDVTYDQVRVWISQSSRLILRAEFLTLQGATLKVADYRYENTLAEGKKSRPFLSRMSIQDPRNADSSTVIELKEPAVASPDPMRFEPSSLVGAVAPKP